MAAEAEQGFPSVFRSAGAAAGTNTFRKIPRSGRRCNWRRATGLSKNKSPIFTTAHKPKSPVALITLTSDIGWKDYLVGAVKGQLAQIDPTFNIVDIAHELSPFNYPQAAYICRNAIRHFPPHTFHIILVNLFEKKPEQLLLAFHNQQYLLCADNGLLNMILEGRPEMVIGLPLDRTEIKNTLYCIRVMGKAILDLSRGAGLLSIGVPD